jgi:hypothetical protein
VRRVSGEATLATLQGHVAIGPIRDSTAGDSCWENARSPVVEIDATGGGMAVAHNGKLTNPAAGAGHLIRQESPPRWSGAPRAISDTDVMTELLARAAGPLAGGHDRPHNAPAWRPHRDHRRCPHRSRQGQCTARGTERCPNPIPNAAVGDLTPCGATQLPALPLSNPEPEVVR